MEQTTRLAIVATDAFLKEFHSALVIFVVACSSFMFSKRWVPGSIRPVMISTVVLVAEMNIHKRGNRDKNAAIIKNRYLPTVAIRLAIISDHLPSSVQMRESLLKQR